MCLSLNVYTKNENIGVIEINENRIRKINISVRNNNFPEINAGVQKKEEIFEKDINSKYQIINIDKGDMLKTDLKFTHMLVNEELSEFIDFYKNSETLLLLKMSKVKSIYVKYINNQTYLQSQSFKEEITKKIFIKVIILIIGIILGFLASNISNMFTANLTTNKNEITKISDRIVSLNSCTDDKKINTNNSGIR